mgnify:CR=1 FL=1
MNDSLDILIDASDDNELKAIAFKVKRNERITDEDCLILFEKGSLSVEAKLEYGVYNLKIPF